MKQMWKLVVVGLLLAANAQGKTPKPLVTIELERHVSAWPTVEQLALAPDVAAAVAGLAEARDKTAELEKALAGTARQEAGESPTELLEKSLVNLRAKRKAALALLRPAAKTVPQWLLLADVEAAEAFDAYEQATESGTKAAKLNLAPVEAICVKAMAAKPDPESARQLDYAWALALEARGQVAEAAKHYLSVAQGAAEPWRSEALYRAGAAALAKDPAGALAAWGQVTASPYVVYAGYRSVTELVKAGDCAAASDALTKLKVAPELSGTSFVEVATTSVAGCKAKGAK